MARMTVEYLQHVGTGEVFAVRVGDDGAIVSARGPLTPAEVGAALFGDPACGAEFLDIPTPAHSGTDEETTAETTTAALDHLRDVNLDRDTAYLSLAPYRQPVTGRGDEGGDGA